MQLTAIYCILCFAYAASLKWNQISQVSRSVDIAPTDVSTNGSLMLRSKLRKLSSAHYLAEFIQMVYHYECPQSGRRFRSFVAEVSYTAGDGLVHFTNIQHIQEFTRPHQYDHHPMQYNGWMMATFCIPHPSYAMGVCKYKYHGYLEGEVYANYMTVRLLGDQASWLFRPRVTEVCRTRSSGDECYIEDQPSYCTIERVDVALL